MATNYAGMGDENVHLGEGCHGEAAQGSAPPNASAAGAEDIVLQDTVRTCLYCDSGEFRSACHRSMLLYVPKGTPGRGRADQFWCEKNIMMNTVLRACQAADTVPVWWLTHMVPRCDCAAGSCDCRPTVLHVQLHSHISKEEYTGLLSETGFTPAKATCGCYDCHPATR